MVKKTQDFISKLPSWIKYATTIISLVATLAGGLYAMDDRYISDKEAAQSLQNFDNKIQQDLNKIQLQILQAELENATEAYYKHKHLMKVYPDDKELEDELLLIKERRDKIKAKISEKVGL